MGSSEVSLVTKVSGARFLLLAASIILLCLLCVVSVILFLFASKDDVFEGENLSNTNTYQMLRIDSSKNRSTLGVISIFEKLEPDEFKSYRTDEGENILISNLGSEEFMCAGSCYCDSNLDRRSSAAIAISRGLVYLVAAVSSVVAYEQAKEYFTEECEKEYATSCPSNSIISNVNHCQNIMLSEKVEENGEFEPTTSDGTVEEKNGIKHWCKGFCALNREELVEVRGMKWQLIDNEQENRGKFDSIDIERFELLKIREKACEMISLEKEVYIAPIEYNGNFDLLGYNEANKKFFDDLLTFCKRLRKDSFCKDPTIVYCRRMMGNKIPSNPLAF